MNLIHIIIDYETGKDGNCSEQHVRETHIARNSAMESVAIKNVLFDFNDEFSYLSSSYLTVFITRLIFAHVR